MSHESEGANTAGASAAGFLWVPTKTAATIHEKNDRRTIDRFIQHGRNIKRRKEEKQQEQEQQRQVQQGILAEVDGVTKGVGRRKGRGGGDGRTAAGTADGSVLAWRLHEYRKPSAQVSWLGLDHRAPFSSFLVHGVHLDGNQVRHVRRGAHHGKRPEPTDGEGDFGEGGSEVELWRAPSLAPDDTRSLQRILHAGSAHDEAVAEADAEGVGSCSMASALSDSPASALSSSSSSPSSSSDSGSIVSMPVGLENSLDPFCRLPLTLSPYECSLVQYYLQKMPARFYGTSSTALFCPVQDVTLTCLQLFPSTLNWVLIAAETDVARNRNLPAPASVLRRRAETYRYLNAKLADPRAQHDEETVHCVVAAVIIESRLAGPDVTRIHLQGLEKLIRARGGLPSLFEGPLALMNICLYMRIHHLGLDEANDSAERAQRTARFAATLDLMACWNQELRGRVHALHTGACRPTSGAAEYLRARREVLAGPALRAFLAPDFPHETPAQRTNHFSLLYGLNLTLFDLRADTAAGTAFLWRFRALVEGSGDVDRFGAMSRLKIDAVPWLLIKARFDVNEMVFPDGAGREREIEWSRAAIDGLGVFGGMGPGERDGLVGLLSAWLLSGIRANGVTVERVEMEDG